MRSREPRRYREASLPSAHRRRRVRGGERRDVGGELGGDWPAARGPRLLFVSSPQGDHDRRRRNDYDPTRGMGPPVPAVATAWDEHSRHRAASLNGRHVRRISDAWLQLPHDGHPGGGWSRAARTAAGDHRAAARPCGSIPPRPCRARAAGHGSGRTGMGALELAELLRPAAAQCRSARCDAVDARPRRLDATRRDVRAPGKRLRDRALALREARAGPVRLRAGPLPRTCELGARHSGRFDSAALSADDGRGPGRSDRRAVGRNQPLRDVREKGRHMVATAELQDIVFAAMSAANLNRADDAQMAIGPEAPIFGPGSPLDSLGLVSLLMDIEDGLAQLGINVTLSDARAMSRKRSPFRDVPELVTFMTELLREAA